MSTLHQRLLDTIPDPERWRDALALLCKRLGVPAALISLRDRETAMIVVGDDLTRTNQSPLLHGFSEAAVGDYIQNYAHRDPWVDVEREHHPHAPYALSSRLPLDALRRTPFWTWLAAQRISDTVICELASDSRHWSALNLYFDAETTDIPHLLAELDTLLPDIRSAWRASRGMPAADLTQGALEGVLRAMPQPSVVVCHEGIIRAVNDAAAVRLMGWGAEVRTGARLGLPSDAELSPGTGATLPAVARDLAAGDRPRIEVRPVLSAELIDGAAHELSLLTFDTGVGPAPIWQDAGLTPREATLVRLVAEGRRFREAQDEMGVSYPRIMQLWKSAREKLGVRDVNDLRVAHRTGGKTPPPFTQV